ncbi:hypothetical protein [Nakamurella sp.]|uniref:hypothetical protein n=1 Tax=Nakamurella sp. TaxID=1869182 RepID=UPI003B3BB067
MRGTAPAKDRARGRVMELRHQGLPSHEISARLAIEGTPLNPRHHHHLQHHRQRRLGG